jgi:hypothetical protein
MGQNFPISQGLSFSTNGGASWAKSAGGNKELQKAAPDSAGVRDCAIGCSANLSWRKEVSDGI